MEPCPSLKIGPLNLVDYGMEWKLIYLGFMAACTEKNECVIE